MKRRKILLFLTLYSIYVRAAARTLLPFDEKGRPRLLLHCCSTEFSFVNRQLLLRIPQPDVRLYENPAQLRTQS